MRESLHAACGQFEQVIIAQVLRTAGGGKRTQDPDAGDDSGACSPSDEGAYAQIFDQALSGALERAGGLGLSRTLEAALDRRPPGAEAGAR